MVVSLPRRLPFFAFGSLLLLPLTVEFKNSQDLKKKTTSLAYIYKIGQKRLVKKIIKKMIYATVF